jgi:beta-glucosidase/6-phospho-beta-glucosidase/beta-galactosidase
VTLVSIDAPSGFASFFQGGFECASHRRRGDRRRLDLTAATEHDRFCRQDYQGLIDHGIRTVRDGLRWHRIERLPGWYDWSSALPMIRAARDLNIQVIWDLCHYGYPDGLDIWSRAFIDRFAAFAAAAAALIRDEQDEIPYYCPINEISYWAWAGGEVGRIDPFAADRGAVLKRQLAKAAVAAVRAIRDVDPRARFVQTDPAIHVRAAPDRPDDADAAERYRQSQFEAWDLMCGTMEPEVGGDPSCLDILGINYYPDNQWFLSGGMIGLGHHCYRPLREILLEISAQYARPMVISETGAESTARPAWLDYVVGEVMAARSEGAKIAGLCLYPILDYPGWDNDRPCEVGLFGPADGTGRRPLCGPLAMALARQQEALASASHGRREQRSSLPALGSAG